MNADLVVVGVAAFAGAGLGAYIRGALTGAKAVGWLHRFARARKETRDAALRAQGCPNCAWPLDAPRSEQEADQ